mmetsp:Transcript_28635/g.62704  ORF Transcript_28635/g.62704 Transcript_28635/m.62704 type:complete len:223 (-) Transcript_28635:1632-2300(-)
MYSWAAPLRRECTEKEALARSILRSTAARSVRSNLRSMRCRSTSGPTSGSRASLSASSSESEAESALASTTPGLISSTLVDRSGNGEVVLLRRAAPAPFLRSRSPMVLRSRGPRAVSSTAESSLAHARCTAGRCFPRALLCFWRRLCISRSRARAAKMSSAARACSAMRAAFSARARSSLRRAASVALLAALSSMNRSASLRLRPQLLRVDSSPTTQPLPLS